MLSSQTIVEWCHCSVLSNMVWSVENEIFENWIHFYRIFWNSAESLTVIDAFAENGVSINRTDKFGRTPIHFAIELGESFCKMAPWCLSRPRPFKIYEFMGFVLWIGLEVVVKHLIESYGKTTMDATNVLDYNGKPQIFLAFKKGKQQTRDYHF